MALARRARSRRRRAGRAKSMGLQHAAQQVQIAEDIAAARQGPMRRKRGRRLDIGRPRHRLYPQAGLVARQAHGLAPIPTVSGNILDDDDDTE